MAISRNSKYLAWQVVALIFMKIVKSGDFSILSDAPHKNSRKIMENLIALLYKIQMRFLEGKVKSRFLMNIFLNIIKTED